MKPTPHTTDHQIDAPHTFGRKRTTIHNALRSVFLLATFSVATIASSQIGVGIKVGTNYVMSAMKIQPDPKDPPTNPKGLGMLFGAYADIPFSDMVGIRPELQFSFRRLKSEQTVVFNYNGDQVSYNNVPGTFTGKEETRVEIDQRLSYFQLNVPIAIEPADGFRIMLGPSFGFLMGGKRNEDSTYELDGTFTDQQNQQTTLNPDPTFTTTERKGSAAIRDFRKMEVAALAGVGYTLPIGFDMDLRYYRGIVTAYDNSEGDERTRIWTNMIEFAIGWTFGGDTASE